MARLKEHYRGTVVGELRERFGYSSVMQVPRLRKITLNMGVGEGASDRKALESAVADLTLISGQKPIVTHGPQVRGRVQDP